MLTSKIRTNANIQSRTNAASFHHTLCKQRRLEHFNTHDIKVVVHSTLMYIFGAYYKMHSSFAMLHYYKGIVISKDKNVGRQTDSAAPGSNTKEHEMRISEYIGKYSF